MTVGTTGTNTGAVLFKGSTAASGTLTLIGQANPTNNTITLPNATGTVCLQSAAACGFATGSGAAFVQGGNSFGATGTLGTTDGNDLNIIRNSATILTVGSAAVTLASNIDLTLQGATAYISNPQTQTASEAFGLSAAVGGNNAVAVGNTATTGNDDVAIGFTATAGTYSVAIGGNSTSSQAGVAVGQAANSGFNSVAIGQGAVANSWGIALGSGATTGGNSQIAIGYKAATTTDNQMVIGGSTADGSYVDNAYLGSGVTDATPQSVILHATGGSGTDIAGANFTLAGGQGTGSGNGGGLNFQVAKPGTSGSGLNSLSTVASLSGSTGAALFQNATDSSAALQVKNAAGSTNALTVDTSGSSAVTIGGTLNAQGNILAAGAATGTTATTSGTGTNTTTVTLTGSAFANNDVIFIDNAGQDFYTRITAGGGTASLTVSPAVTFENTRTVTKYTVQNIGATATDYTTQANRFFQGYFLGGVVTGAGSTTLSDQRLLSSGDLNLNATTGLNLTGGANSSLNVGANTLAITSANFSVTGPGALTAASINSGSGLLQGTGGLTVTGAVSINTSASNATNIGTGTNAGTITIGNISSGDLALNDANWSVTGAGLITTSSNLAVNGGQITSTGSLTLDATSTVIIPGTDTFQSDDVTSTGALSLQSGSAAINLGTSSATGLTIGSTGSFGSAVVKSNNNAAAFQVQDSASAGLLTVDASARSGSGGNLIKIGNSSGVDTDLTILQLDSIAGVPSSNLAALSGGLFYDSTAKRIKLIEDGAIKTICNTVDLGCGTGTVTLQNAYDNGATASISMSTGRDLTVTSPDVATDPSFVFNTQCTTCSASGGRFVVQNAATDVFVVSPNSLGITLGSSTLNTPVTVDTGTGAITLGQGTGE